MAKITKKNEKVNYEVKVTRAFMCSNDNIAIDVNINGVSIYGGFLIYSEKNKNYFYSFPSYKGSDGNYYNYAWCPLSKEVTEEITKQAEKLLADD